MENRFSAWTGVLCLFALVLGLFSGCRPVQPTTSEDPAAHITIGFSMATLLEDRWLRDRDIFLAKAQQRNIDVLIRNANKDSDVQYEQVQELLAQDIDVLVIAPNDSVQEARCVQAAHNNGVPVVLYDRFIQNSGADVYISFDSEEVGRLMGADLLARAPKGGYLLVNGPKTDNNSLMIYDGYMQVLQPYIDSGDIFVVSEHWTEGWVRENAYDFVSRNIELFRSNLVAAVCENDSLARGVTDALDEARLSKSVSVTGMDADLAACQRIATGRQAMTVYKPIPILVENTLNACEQLAKGIKPDTTRTLFDGKYDIPYIAIGVKPVTLETLDETVIADGFHLKEEIYDP